MDLDNGSFNEILTKVMEVNNSVNIGKKVYRVLSSILSFLFIVAATIAVIFYANGYRIGRDGTVEITGVLTIKSSPGRSEVKLSSENEESKKGKTTKTFSSLPGDKVYQVEVTREEYYTWSKAVSIKPEKSTPLFAYLFRTDPERDLQAEIDKENLLLQSVTSEDRKKIFILTSLPVEGDAESKIYRIWYFNNSPRFWDTSDNPRPIAELKEKGVTEINFLLSPDGEKILWSIKKDTIIETKHEESGEIVKSTQKDLNRYLFDSTSTHSESDLKEIDLSQFDDSYKIVWSKDSNYIMLESEDEILSFDTESEGKTLLIKKDKNSNEKVIWNSGADSNFYYLQYKSISSETAVAQIMTQKLSGSKPESVINNIYITLNSDSGISGELADLQEPFTSSPDGRRFVGKVSSINILDDEDGILIGTDKALYFYSLEDDKYILISQTASQYISSNFNSTKLLFSSNNGSEIGIFTFDKEDEDHTEEIGTKTLINTGSQDKTEVIQNIFWHSNSEYIFFEEHNQLKVIDDEGDNLLTLLTLDNVFHYSISTDSEKVVIVEDHDEANKIVTYTIH